MKCLADACALLSFFGTSELRLTERGRDAMHGVVAISPVTVWELSRKASTGKLPPLPRLNGSFARYLASQGFQAEAFTWEDAELANTLPFHHKDPFDRMLVATAQRCGLPLITCDDVFAAYDVTTIW